MILLDVLSPLLSFPFFIMFLLCCSTLFSLPVYFPFSPLVLMFPSISIFRFPNFPFLYFFLTFVPLSPSPPLPFTPFTLWCVSRVFEKGENGIQMNLTRYMRRTGRMFKKWKLCRIKMLLKYQKMQSFPLFAFVFVPRTPRLPPSCPSEALVILLNLLSSAPLQFCCSISGQVRVVRMWCSFFCAFF